MKRLMVALCSLAVSATVALSTPKVADAKPICPRGETFTNCISMCPNDIATGCLSAIGFQGTGACLVDREQSSCEADYFCQTLNPNTPLKLTCTYY